MNECRHMRYQIEQEGSVDLYELAPGIGLSFNQIYTSSWSTGKGTLLSPRDADH